MDLTSEFASGERLRLIYAPASADDIGGESLAEAARLGLTQNPKNIPCRFFYDTIGSELFEQITELPEYYLTRCERSIFERWAPDMVASIDGPVSVVELGSGSSKKTRFLIEALLESQRELDYVSIDIAADYLETASRNLLDEYPRLRVTAIAGEYLSGLAALPDDLRQRLFLFLGSNLGNFDEGEALTFLQRINESMAPKDSLLVGVDFAKDAAIIEPAYDDSSGITEAFNKNLLQRLNAELGADFDAAAFTHRAPYSYHEGRVEMHLISNREQRVWIPALGQAFAFKEGESIHTETCRKFSRPEFADLASEAGFCIDNWWTDDRGWFGLFLLRPTN